MHLGKGRDEDQLTDTNLFPISRARLWEHKFRPKGYIVTTNVEEMRSYLLCTGINGEGLISWDTRPDEDQKRKPWIIYQTETNVQMLAQY